MKLIDEFSPANRSTCLPENGKWEKQLGVKQNIDSLLMLAVFINISLFYVSSVNVQYMQSVMCYLVEIKVLLRLNYVCYFFFRIGSVILY